MATTEAHCWTSLPDLAPGPREGLDSASQENIPFRRLSMIQLRIWGWDGVRGRLAARVWLLPYRHPPSLQNDHTMMLGWLRCSFTICANAGSCSASRSRVSSQT